MAAWQGLSKKLIRQDHLRLLSLDAVPAFTCFLEGAEMFPFPPLLHSQFLCLQTLKKKQFITPANVNQRLLAQKEQTVHFCKFAFLVSLLFCGGRQLLPAWESHSLLASLRWLSEATGAQQEGNPVQTHNVPCDQASDSSRAAASASAHRCSQGTLLLMVSESTLCFREKCWDEEGWGRQWL